MAFPPPKGKDQTVVPTSVGLPRWMQKRLDEVTKARGYRSRSELIVRIIEAALQELDEEEKAKKR